MALWLTLFPNLPILRYKTRKAMGSDRDIWTIENCWEQVGAIENGLINLDSVEGNWICQLSPFPRRYWIRTGSRLVNDEHGFKLDGGSGGRAERGLAGLCGTGRAGRAEADPVGCVAGAGSAGGGGVYPESFAQGAGGRT